MIGRERWKEKVNEEGEERMEWKTPRWRGWGICSRSSRIAGEYQKEEL